MRINPVLLHELAKDFREAFDEDENKTAYSPSDFWSRWKQQGRELPHVTEIVQIVSFVRQVGHYAANMENTHEKN